MPRPPKYPIELRHRAVRLVIEQGCSISQVASDIGIRYELLRRWVRQAEADAGERQDLRSTEEQKRITALERENQELRGANDILKAASAFFAAELDPRRPR